LIIRYNLIQSVDTFVDELRWEETDAVKRDKIRPLKLDGDEWQCVNMFCGLLAVCISHTLPIQIYETTILARRQRTASLFI
jgi:hypothetical protein